MPKSLALLTYELEKAEAALHRAWEASSNPMLLWSRPNAISEEDYEKLCSIRFEAEMTFRQALWDRVKSKRDRFLRSKTVPRMRDWFKLRNELARAQSHSEQLEELGPDFSTMAERCQAHAEAWLAGELLEIAGAKIRAAQQRQLNDKRAGIIRISYPRKHHVRQR
jgi:hypothetical protein